MLFKRGDIVCVKGYENKGSRYKIIHVHPSTQTYDVKVYHDTDEYPDIYKGVSESTFSPAGPKPSFFD